MKLNKILVTVRPFEESMEFTKRQLKAMLEKKPYHANVLNFETLLGFRRVFTDKRMELLKAIRRHEPQSVYALAELLKRDLKSVNTDLKVLVNEGLVSLKKSMTSRKCVTPSVGFNEIDIRMRI